jgi:Protein of unknown function (DUF3108)
MGESKEDVSAIVVRQRPASNRHEGLKRANRAGQICLFFPSRTTFTYDTIQNDYVLSMYSPKDSRVSIVAVILLCCTAGLSSLSDSPMFPAGVQFPLKNGIMMPGEELLYEVSWTWFKLGTIRLKSGQRYSAEAHIHSYPDIPFVDLHSVQYSSMDSMFFSRGSNSVEKQDGDWKGLRYLTDTVKSRLFVEETYRKQLNAEPYRREWKDTIQLASPLFVDGLSIGYFPRLFVHSVQTIVVPTVLYGKLGITTFRFTNEKTTESLEMLDEPVRVIEVKGTTTVEGVFGMTGDFTGWFSDDSAAVPIKGRLKVLLGNVTVELIDWKRDGWHPPQ